MEAFSTASVVEILTPYGVTMEGFKNWLRKGFVKPSIQGRRGTQNIFDFEDLLYVALFKHMVDVGGGTRDEVAFFLQENIGGSLAEARREGKKFLRIAGGKNLLSGNFVRTDEGYEPVLHGKKGIVEVATCQFCNEIPTEAIEKGDLTFLYVINIEAIANQIRTILLNRNKGESGKTE